MGKLENLQNYRTFNARSVTDNMKVWRQSNILDTVKIKI